jgi:hypothetical protein
MHNGILGTSKHQVLSSDPKTGTIREKRGSTYGSAVDPNAVARTSVLDGRLFGGHDNPRMRPRHQWIVDGQAAIRTSANHQLPKGEVHFVEQKSQSKSRQLWPLRWAQQHAHNILRI